MTLVNDYERVKSAVLALGKEKARVVVAVDGPCAAGKTTLSERLATELDAMLIHADDFFLPPERRTAERDSEVGGNIDYERLKSEVIDRLPSNEPFSYRKYNCRLGSYTEVAVTPRKVCVIEGSYSCHPYFGCPYDVKVFVDVDAAEQRRRIEKRNPCSASTFFNVWIPKENAYFAAFSIKKNADIVIR